MKTIGTMLCLASLLLLAACTAGPEEAAGTQDTTLPGAAVATCRVVDVQDGQLILAAADGGENDVYALALGDLPVTQSNGDRTGESDPDRLRRHGGGDLPRPAGERGGYPGPGGRL